MNIGTLVFRCRWVIVSIWVIAAGLLIYLVPAVDPSIDERTTFLPSDTPHSLAVEAFGKSFPQNSGLSEAVIVFERRDKPLTSEDKAKIEEIAERIPRPVSPNTSAKDLEGITVLSPGLILLPQNPLISKVSRNGQGALINVNIPANFITLRSARVVDHIRWILNAADLPEGLTAAVTGSSGFGRDYAAAAERSHRQTLLVTLVAVIVILLLVYRAPVAALIPLGAISLGAIVVMKLLGLAEHFGMHSGTAERIFVVVLLYGAGIDYSLLLISRYQENLNSSVAPPGAIAAALGATFLAILAAAGTDTAGLLMLCFADFGIFRTTGPAVGIALIVALLAAVTLVPGLVGILGKRVFWPGKRMGIIGRRRLWPKLAGLVTRRPAAVLIVTLILLGAPAVRGAHLTWVYDTLAALRGDYGAARGIKAAKRHWPVGEVAPVKILFRTANPIDANTWVNNVQHLTQALVNLRHVRNVRSLWTPLGSQAGGINAVARTAGRTKVLSEYVSADRRAIRMEVVLDQPALSLQAMHAVREIRQTLTDTGAQLDLKPDVHVAGATAEIMDIRAVTQRDFYRIAALALGVIFIIVVTLLRDVILTAFMVASTVLSYLATLGIAYWVFAGLLGQEGLDWKVEVFLFVVMVAVGVDYNIFLAARLFQELRRLPRRQAVREAIIQTGPVISSCGVIMAATLGSLMAGDLQLLQQLGFALALGMLIDTFIVRPLLLPAFALLTRRTGPTG